MNLSAAEHAYLARIPRETEQVNAWLSDMPIWQLYIETPTGAWTLSEAKHLVEASVRFLQHDGVPYRELIILTGNCIAMYREMLFPGKACTDENLLGDLAAVIYQLVNNIIDAGFKMGMAHFGGDLETAQQEECIFLEEYPASDTYIQEGIGENHA
jgi:hypothetical protein